jgi:hypothetical protein
MNWNNIFKYGNTVDGYDIPVINEREARAAAGILFAIGMLSLTNAVMLSHGIVTRYFISFFTFDFLIRVINPNYSPSMLLGRYFVKNQKPEYVGAAQKRFAWGIGLILAFPMFYLLVIHWQPTPIKVFICMICLVLLFLESAFSICLGCKIYNFIMTKKAQYCPGGACEIQTKDKIQTFNIFQKIIAISTAILLITGIYFYTYKLENKTHIAQFLSDMLMSKEQRKIKEEQEYQKQLDQFDEDDDDEEEED